MYTNGKKERSYNCDYCGRSVYLYEILTKEEEEALKAEEEALQRIRTTDTTRLFSEAAERISQVNSELCEAKKRMINESNNVNYKDFYFSAFEVWFTNGRCELITAYYAYITHSVMRNDRLTDQINYNALPVALFDYDTSSDKHFRSVDVLMASLFADYWRQHGTFNRDVSLPIPKEKVLMCPTK